MPTRAQTLVALALKEAPRCGATQLHWQGGRGGGGASSHRLGQKPALAYTRLAFSSPARCLLSVSALIYNEDFEQASKGTHPQHGHAVQHSFMQSGMGPSSRCTHLADLQHDHAVQHSLGQSGVTHERVLTPGDVGPIDVRIEVPAHPAAQSRQMGAQADVRGRHRHRMNAGAAQPCGC